VLRLDETRSTIRSRNCYLVCSLNRSTNRSNNISNNRSNNRSSKLVHVRHLTAPARNYNVTLADAWFQALYA